MPTPTWDRLPRTRREAIIAAAEAEFAANGFSRGSLNVIAREAGVAKGSLFQYFHDKLDLFAHLCELTSIRIGAAMAKHSADLPWESDYFGAITEWLKAWVHYFRDHPTDLAITAAVNLELDQSARVAVRDVVNRHYVDGLRTMVRQGVTVGALRSDADLEACVALMVLLLPHLALATNLPGLDPILNLDRDPEEGVARLVRVLREAFGSNGDTPIG